MVKKECYTKKTKSGANYTTCVEGQKKPKTIKIKKKPKKECYTKKTKSGANYTTCVEGQKKPKTIKIKKKPTAKGINTIQKKIKTTRKLKNKSTIKPPLTKSKVKPKPPAQKKLSAGKSVLFTQKGFMSMVGSFRKDMRRSYTAEQIKDIIDNNILKLYQNDYLEDGGNLEEILRNSLVTEAENSYWGSYGPDFITARGGRTIWYDANALPSMKTRYNAFKDMYPLLIGWLSMDKYKNANEVLKAAARLIHKLLTDNVTYLKKLHLKLKDEPFYYPDERDRRISNDKWDSFMEEKYTPYVKKLKLSKKKLALGRLFRGIIEGREFNVAGPNVNKLVKLNLDRVWGTDMLVYTPRIVKGKSVMGLSKDAIKTKTLIDHLKKVYK